MEQRVKIVGTRKYIIDQLYLEGCILRQIRYGEDRDIEIGVDLTEAAEIASEYNRGVRCFTGVRRQVKRRQLV